MNIKKVCVYCASSTQISEKHINCASKLGEIFSKNNITTVYGGGSVGSMGALATSTLNNGGKIIGVIPQFMMELEWGNPHITQMIVVNTMAERKQKFIEEVDAVVALPGGTGTLEELCETLSLKKLGLFTKPVIIVNTDGFYNPFLDLIDRMIADSFIRPEHKKLYVVIDSPEEVIEAIQNSPVWNEAAKFAAI
jgi:uncharacterized protein (TIGR00730 family)